MTSNRDFWAVLPLFCQANLHISYTFRGALRLIFNIILSVIRAYRALRNFAVFSTRFVWSDYLGFYWTFSLYAALFQPDDRYRFRRSFPHTFSQVAFSWFWAVFAPDPENGRIVNVEYDHEHDFFFVENLFYQTLWDIHSAIHFNAHAITGLISYPFCDLAGAIFFVSTGRDSIPEYGQTSPFLAAFHTHF